MGCVCCVTWCRKKQTKEDKSVKFYSFPSNTQQYERWKSFVNFANFSLLIEQREILAPTVICKGIYLPPVHKKVEVFNICIYSLHDNEVKFF